MLDDSKYLRCVHMRRVGPEAVQAACVQALGAANPGCLAALVEELQPVLDDAAADRAKARRPLPPSSFC